MKAKKILAPLILVAVIAGLVAALAIAIPKRGSAKIIATNFAAYDFARAVTNERNDIKLLIKPAAETHTFEPTPQDIIDIVNADFFIYNGGESEEWVSDLLRDNGVDEGKTIRMMDFVELKQEEDEDEYDEHIWTSPLNAIRITEAIRDRFIAKYPAKAEKYISNTNNYVAKLKDIDQKNREIVKNAKRKVLVFADRFPFRYFVDEYGLDYLAAFPGCSEQTEASSSTIAELTDKVKSEKVPVVLKIELTSDALAKTIASETGAAIRTFSAAHNISQADFESGKTYADIMTDNLKVLEEALN